MSLHSYNGLIVYFCMCGITGSQGSNCTLKNYIEKRISVIYNNSMILEALMSFPYSFRNCTLSLAWKVI